MKIKLYSAILAVLVTSPIVHGAVVYQSDFTGADLGAGITNEGILSSGNWVHNATGDHAEFDWLARNGRAALYTTDSYQSDGGFTLDVTFLQTVNGSRFSIGLVDSAFSGSADGDWLNSALPGAYGIGISTSGAVADSAGGDVLAFNAGGTAKNNFDDVTELSTAQGSITLGTVQTLSLTVTSTTWSYSLNGAPATAGTHTFDTSKSYQYINYIQETSNPQSEAAADSGMQGSYISNITLTAIPEPSSAAMLGLGGLALILRRRK